MLYNVIVNGRQEYIREGYVGAIDCVKFYYPEFPLNQFWSSGRQRISARSDDSMDSPLPTKHLDINNQCGSLAMERLGWVGNYLWHAHCKGKVFNIQVTNGVHDIVHSAFNEIGWHIRTNIQFD